MTCGHSIIVASHGAFPTLFVGSDVVERQLTSLLLQEVKVGIEIVLVYYTWLLIGSYSGSYHHSNTGVIAESRATT